MKGFFFSEVAEPVRNILVTFLYMGGKERKEKGGGGGRKKEERRRGREKEKGKSIGLVMILLFILTILQMLLYDCQ